jgi:hypothetical protein
MALSTRLSLDLAATLTSALDLATASVPLAYRRDYVWASGTGASQADKQWNDQRTIAASSTDSLDLAGSLTDPFGATLTFARIKGVLVYAATANTNNVNVTRPASNGAPLFLAAGDGIPVRPGGLFLWMAPDSTGVAVTGGTGDLLDIVNSGAGTSVTYDIVVIGASA